MALMQKPLERCSPGKIFPEKMFPKISRSRPLQDAFVRLAVCRFTVWREQAAECLLPATLNVRGVRKGSQIFQDNVSCSNNPSQWPEDLTRFYMIICLVSELQHALDTFRCQCQAARWTAAERERLLG